MVHVQGLDHVVLSVKDVEGPLSFYHGILGMEALRVEEFRAGKVGFLSLRASGTPIIDLKKAKAPHEGVNVDHFALLIELTDMNALIVEPRAKGVLVNGQTGQRWGAQGRGPSVYIQDPDENTVELKRYPPVAEAQPAFKAFA